MDEPELRREALENRQAMTLRVPLSPALVEQAREIAYTRLRADRGGRPVELDHLLVIMEERLFEPGFDADELRRATAVNEATLLHFRFRFGVDVDAYMNQRRLEAALFLAARSDADPSQIGASLGIGESEAFREWLTGLSGQDRCPASSAPGDAPSPDSDRWQQTGLGALPAHDVAALVRVLKSRDPEIW